MLNENIDKTKKLYVWEHITADICRLRVFGGWLVNSGGTTNIAFVPDAFHEWIPGKVDEESPLTSYPHPLTFYPHPLDYVKEY